MLAADGGEVVEGVCEGECVFGLVVADEELHAAVARQVVEGFAGGQPVHGGELADAGHEPLDPGPAFRVPPPIGGGCRGCAGRSHVCLVLSNPAAS